MSKFTSYAVAALLLATATVSDAQNTPVSRMEHLTRGVVAVPASSGNGMFVSWRMFGTDDDLTTFDLLRDGVVVKKDIVDKTNYVDVNGFTSSEYQVVAKHNGVEVDRSEPVTGWSNLYMQIPLDKPADGNVKGSAYSYSPNDCSVGDVDGDGEYEIILKWDPSNSKDNSQSGYTGNVLIDCYKLDGTKLWRVDLGQNIRAGAHYTQFLVYDFDGDGKAEMMCKTATGSKDATGAYVNSVATDPDIQSADNEKDWRNSSGKVTGGQEYLTVFDGETGKAMHTVFYNPNRAMGYGGAPGWTVNWDDRSGKEDKEYGNRGERYLATVAYLDGPDKNPSAVFVRGYYTFAFLWAVGFDGKEITTKWLHSAKSKTKYTVTYPDADDFTQMPGRSTSGTGSYTAYGNGNHNLSAGDVDGDGCDEIVWGGCAIDQDGKQLYATGYGHGDAMHLSDLMPDRPGLEVFTVHESSPYGWNIHDAATGEILHYSKGSDDNGRGLAADIDLNSRGFEFWSSNDRSIRSAVDGSVVSTKSTTVNFRTYWDGDLDDEILDGNKMDKWIGDGTERIYPISGKNFYDIANSSTCNGTKNTPNLQADILGDWREELIFWDGSDAAHLNVFTTNVPTDFRVPTLMHDHVYRLGVAWQNVAYNQPPHLGYYLPDYFSTRYAVLGEGGFEQTVALGEPIKDIECRWVNSNAPSLYNCIAPDGTETKTAPEGFKFVRNTYTTKTFTLSGTPTMEGLYEFVIKSGANVVDNSTKYDTIRINCVDPSGIVDASTAGDGGWARVAGGVFADQIAIDVNVSGQQNVAVSIYNAAGAQVFGRQYGVAGSSRLTVDGLGNLREGIYVLRVESASGRYVKKLIKR